MFSLRHLAGMGWHRASWTNGG